MTNYANPKEPKSLSTNYIERVTGRTNPSDTWAYKKIFYPSITWTQELFDVNNVALPKRFGGYQIERNVVTNGVEGGWETIAFIPSYIVALNRQITYFYDYSIENLPFSYNINTVVCKYRLKSVLYTGQSSVLSTETSVTLKKDELYDINNIKIG
jgi:hypothetical protein